MTAGHPPEGSVVPAGEFALVTSDDGTDLVLLTPNPELDVAIGPTAQLLVAVMMRLHSTEPTDHAWARELMLWFRLRMGDVEESA